ncbi:hypothetical protein HDU92_004835 [Lobulomyces angularis]|nr:hypothetical protein HDU92_004835 [Lobulomyces angularis]
MTSEEVYDIAYFQSDNCNNGFQPFLNNSEIFIMCTRTLSNCRLGLHGVALFISFGIFCYSFLSVKKNNIQNKLDNLLILTQFCWMIKMLLFFSVDCLAVIENSQDWIWPAADIMYILVTERFWFVAKAFYDIPKNFLLIALTVTAFVYICSSVAPFLDNLCWYLWDIEHGSDESLLNLPNICFLTKFQSSPYSFASWIVQVWFKSATDLFLGLWLIKLLLESERIAKTFEKKILLSKEEPTLVRKSMATKKKLNRIRRNLLKFLIMWLSLVFTILAVYTLNRIPNNRLYSINEYSNNNVIELITAALQVLRSLELWIYFKYMEVLKSLVKVGTGAIEKKLSTKQVTELSTIEMNGAATSLQLNDKPGSRDFEDD